MDHSGFANNSNQNLNQSSSFTSERAIDANGSTNWQESPRRPVSISNQFYVCHYRLTRARCLILNYQKFLNDNHNEREGSEKDVEVLQKTFKNFGFDVETKHNLTAKATRDALEKERNQSKSYDCFVLCILSHGIMQKIFCHDEELLLDEIFNSFNPENCKSLAGKPKLFFIQACRGDSEDNKTAATDGSNSSVSDHFSIPAYSDFLIFYSTYPGHYAFRNKYDGSWFVQDLCKVLCDYAKHFDLMSMLTLTCGKVAFERISHSLTNEELKGKKQMPCIVSTLTRSIRLGPFSDDS